MQQFLRYVLLLSMLLFLGTSAVNLLKNASFENFSSGDPTGWTTNNIPTMLTVVSASSNRFAGKTSVKCEVKDFYGTQMAGMISQKDIEVGKGELQLKGAYLLRSVGKDVGYIAVDIKTAANSTIATCERYLNESGDGFIPFSVSSRLPENAKRIDILLTIMAEKGHSTSHVGSYVLYDALELSVLGKESGDIQ